MTTRKTTTGYKVTIDFDQRQEKFDFYEDVKVCFKNVSRDYDLSKITSDFVLDDWEIDYLLGKVSKQEVLDDDVCRSDKDFEELDEYKNNYEVVGLSFGEHSNIYIGYGDDGVMLVGKGAKPEYIHELIKNLNNWMNGRIYRVDIYEAMNYISENSGEKDLIHWEYVDGQSGYFTPEDALDSLPDYAGEIIKDTEQETFNAFEWVC